MAKEFDPYKVFERAAEQWPDRPALSIGANSWTYTELRNLALNYSAWCEANTKKPARVAVFGRKTVEAYAAILGILRAGRTYVPLHPDHPPARWQTMLERAGVQVGFVSEADQGKLSEIHGVQWCSDPGVSTEASTQSYINKQVEAYVMFTSGSTGGPKGVPVGRWQVASYLEHQLNTWPFGPEDRFTQFFALTFDLSVHDLFVCWGSGGCLCVQEEDAPLRSAAFVREQKITVWFSVPSQVRVLRRMRALQPGSLPSLTHSFFCGEALTADIAKGWRAAAPQSKIINLYGPTEATIAVTALQVDEKHLSNAGALPIGTPFPGHAVLIDDGTALVPQGEGELLVNGPQVNAGYLEDQEATLRAFIHADDGIWYRTGDRVRIGADGIIHFLGRVDDQVKLMGHRVEPAEVDAVLAPVLNGGTSITLPVERAGTTILYTFIDVDKDQQELFARLRSMVPAHMLPERIISVKSMPYNAHGKLDRGCLLAMVTDPAI